MNSKPKKRRPVCAICGGQLRRTAITHEEKRAAKIYLVENVPAKICQVCGEVWIAGTTLKEIDRLIQNGAPVRKIATPVYDFAVAAAR